MALVEDCLTPIKGSDPCGVDLDNEVVSSNVADLLKYVHDPLSGTRPPDYKAARKLAYEALHKKGKDLRMAVMLTEALVGSQGISGLRQGLEVVGGLLGPQFWDGLYPRLDDGDASERSAKIYRLDECAEKIKDVAFLAAGTTWREYSELQDDEALSKALSGTTVEYLESAQAEIKGCLESIGFLNGVGKGKMGERGDLLNKLPDSLGVIQTSLDNLLRRVRPPELAEASTDMGATPAGQQVVLGGGAVAAVAARVTAPSQQASIDPESREDAFERIIKCVRYLRSIDSDDPAPFLLLRGLRWAELRANPSILKAPPTESRENLRRALREESWGDLLSMAEDAFEQPWATGWLDLHYYAIEACRNGGRGGLAASLESMLRAIVADFPNLLDESLSDGTPCVNVEHRQWFHRLVVHKGGDTSNETAAPRESAAPDVFEQAMELLRGRRLPEAVEMLSRSIAKQDDGRSAFLRRMQLAQVCLEGRNAEMALPILEELAREIETLQLSRWESAQFLVQPLLLLHRCLTELGKADEERRRVFHRICLLSPEHALTLV